MKHGISIRMAVLSLSLAAALPTASSAEEGRFITDSRLGDILLADLGSFAGGFAAVGLNFLALGVLGADGRLEAGEQMIGSAVTELSDIPLFLSGSPDA